MKKLLFIILLFQVSFGFAQQNLLQYVLPIIGAEKMGHTYPGATVPFGAVQLSPETDTVSYEKDGKYNGEVYPVAPGSDQYALGSPLVNEAKLQLENGNVFTVEAINQSEENVYVQKVMLNGKVLNQFTISHSDITMGSKLTFYMEPKPKK